MINLQVPTGVYPSDTSKHRNTHRARTFGTPASTGYLYPERIRLADGYKFIYNYVSPVDGYLIYVIGPDLPVICGKAIQRDKKRLGYT